MRGLLAQLTIFILSLIVGFATHKIVHSSFVPLISQSSLPQQTSASYGSQPPLLPCSEIRSVDFGNFKYPAEPIFGSGRKSFTLRDWEFPEKLDRNGRAEEVGLSASVSYADVTGDSIEDALIVFDLETGGSAILSAVYIYTTGPSGPEMLWGFIAGDRADGGLKSVYGENGELVVELEGKDKVIGRNLYEDDGTKNGDCCPTYFTRTRYRWSGKQFQKSARPEVLPLAGSRDRFPEYSECR